MAEGRSLNRVASVKVGAALTECGHLIWSHLGHGEDSGAKGLDAPNLSTDSIGAPSWPITVHDSSRVDGPTTR